MPCFQLIAHWESSCWYKNTILLVFVSFADLKKITAQGDNIFCPVSQPFSWSLHYLPCLSLFDQLERDWQRLSSYWMIHVSNHCIVLTDFGCPAVMMTTAHGGISHQVFVRVGPVNQKIYFSHSALSSSQPGPVQRPHVGKHCTSPSVNLQLHSHLVHKQNSLIPEHLNVGQQLHNFPSKIQGVWLRGADIVLHLAA